MTRSKFLARSKSITGKIYSKPSIKPANTRKIIRRYHLLINKKQLIYQKLSQYLNADVNDDNIKSFAKSKADSHERPSDSELLSISNNNVSVDNLYNTLSKIDFEINENGGLVKYQIASLKGQESKRGSDSSKWLFEALPSLRDTTLKALEIGSLSTDNYISKYCQTTRIDLNSNDPGITKQDFMERPLPQDETAKFDIISCSLVLNFVSSPQNRGAMLKRFLSFAKQNAKLFIVLPLSCITNSRYCDKSHFQHIMETLGFELVKYHEAKKLVYMIFSLERNHTPSPVPKEKLYDRAGMNNFSIVLE